MVEIVSLRLEESRSNEGLKGHQNGVLIFFFRVVTDLFFHRWKLILVELPMCLVTYSTQSTMGL